MDGFLKIGATDTLVDVTENEHDVGQSMLASVGKALGYEAPKVVAEAAAPVMKVRVKKSKRDDYIVAGLDLINPVVRVHEDTIPVKPDEQVDADRGPYRVIKLRPQWFQVILKKANGVKPYVRAAVMSGNQATRLAARFNRAA